MNGLIDEYMVSFGKLVEADAQAAVETENFRDAVHELEPLLKGISVVAEENESAGPQL